jgi:tetrahydromethanopterin S-methyltransferase subunit G
MFMEKASRSVPKAQLSAEEIEKVQAGLDSMESKPLLTSEEVRNLAMVRITPLGPES